MNVNGVNMYRQPVQVDTASYYSFATASAAGGYAKNFASQTAAYGAIVPYPVSPFSSNLDNPDDAAAAQTAALMGIHQAFDAYVAPTVATWENNSAYAMGISQNGILTRSGAATNYGYLEVNLDVTLGVGAMRCVLLTYYYAGRLIG